MDIPSTNGLLRVRIRAAILLAACASSLGCTQDAWRTAARRLRPSEALSHSAPESFGKPAHVAIGTRRPLPADFSPLRGAAFPDREPTRAAAQLARPEQRSTPAYPEIVAGPRDGAAVRTSPRRPSSAYEPAGFPKNPFVTDIDRQLNELRTAAKGTRQEKPFDEMKENPFMDRPVTAATVNAPHPEGARIGRRAANPFETPDLPVEAPVPRVQMTASPTPGPEERKGSTPESAIRPVALKVTTTVAAERAGRPDPTMIVDSDMLPPRLAGPPAGSTIRGRSAAVLELEGPGEAASQSADRRTSDWMAHPEVAEQRAATAAPAPPPPVVAEPPQRAKIRVAQRERSWSGSRTMKNVRWGATADQVADGIPRPSMPIVLGVVLLALAAWSRFRRRSAA